MIQSKKGRVTVGFPTLLLGFEFHGHDIRAGIGFTHGQSSYVLPGH